MHCPACGAENTDDNRFCGACGAVLAVVCAGCGRRNPPENRFCGGCGARLGDAAGTGEPAAASMVDEAAAPAGERRQVTIVFADITGFTKMSNEIDPEETLDLLNRFFEAADGIIERYGGTVDKHIGDNVMAVFGAPVAHGNDPERAVRASLDIHQAMPGLSTALGREIAVHIGIASGEVVASGTGSASHQEYTVTGESVNLASRLDDMAGPGQTLVSDSVRRAVESIFACDEAGDLDVKGFAGPITAWRVTGSAAGKVERKPLVGRRVELRQIMTVIEAACDGGQGQTLLLRGEAGIGKTRLLEEVRDRAAAKGMAVHSGMVLDFGVGRGQDAIGGVVRGLLGLAPGDDETARGAALAAAIADGTLAATHQAHMNDLLDLPQPLEQRAVYDAMDEAARHRGRKGALAALHEGVARCGPVLVTVEDVHLADSGVLGHLAALAAAVIDCPAVLIISSRIEGDPIDQGWRAAAGNVPLITIDLAPLRDDEALAMASDYLDATDRFARNCVDRAEGNPLFLEQLLRGAQDTANGAIPGSVQSVVLARVDRLAAADKEALQAASVIGKRFSPDLLRYLLDKPDYDGAGLIAHYLVRPEGEDLLFAHAMIQESVYASLLNTRKQALHRRAGEWYRPRDIALAAEHFDRAGDAGAPSAYLAAAREQAESFHDQRALGLAERGRALAAEGGDKFALTRLEAELRQRLGAPKESIDIFRRALDLAESDIGRCRCWIGIAAGVRLMGGYDEGMEALDEAEELARRVDAAEHDLELAQIHWYRGNFHFATGNIAGVLEQQALARTHAERAHDPEWEARALGGLGDAHYARGRMSTALDYFRRCIALAQEHGFGRIVVGNLYMVAVTRRYMNQLEEGLADLRDAVSMAARAEDRRAEMYGANLMGEFLIDRCDYEQAAPVLEKTVAMTDSLGNRRFRAYPMAHQARAALMRNKVGEARAILDEAMTICRETGMTFIGPRVLGVLALEHAGDAEARATALAEGEAVLAQGCNAHNHLWYRRDAIEASLAGGDWDGVERHASALENFTADEPLPWSDFFVARGRTLAAHGRGARDAATMAELERLRDEAARIGVRIALPALEKALADG